MVLENFTRGSPEQSGLYSFQDWEGNVYPRIVMVTNKSETWFIETIEGRKEEMLEWFDRKSIIAFLLISTGK